MKKKQNRSSFTPRAWDTAVIILFSLIAIAFTLGRIGNRIDHYIFSSSDADNIASFAAAWDHPEYFNNDPLLKDSANFRYYSTIHIPLIRWLGEITGNYSAPFALLLFPFLLLHLSGYYLLGQVLFKNRILSILCSMTLIVPVSINLGEVWGMYETIPRFLFQALLPFLLAAVVHNGKKIRHWPWLLAMTGLLVYIHPVSLPPWGLAILFSLYIMASDVPWRTRVVRLIISSLFFLIIISPFVFNYFSNTNFGSQVNVDYKAVREIMLQRFNFGLINLRVGLKDFIKIIMLSNWLNITLWILVFIGGVGLFIKKRKTEHDWNGYVLATWWVGILIISVFLPVVDQLITSALKRTPFEVELIRNIRYFIPLLIISAFYILSELMSIISVEIKSIMSSRVFIGIFVGSLLMLAWMIRYDFFKNPSISNNASCWKSGELVCSLPDQKMIDQRYDLLDAVKLSTPVGSRILCTEMSTCLAIRYHSLRPLVYNYKDGASFIYTNFEDLLDWWELYRELWYIEKEISDRRVYLNQLVWFADKNQTDYLVLSEAFNSDNYYPSNLNMVYSNNYFSLFKMSPKS